MPVPTHHAAVVVEAGGMQIVKAGAIEAGGAAVSRCISAAAAAAAAASLGEGRQRLARTHAIAETRAEREATSRQSHRSVGQRAAT